MSKAEPTIQKYMTTTPISIEAKESMASAAALMDKQRIRHLPVMNKGEIAGLISDRDIKMASGIEGVDPESVPVLDACTESVYKVDPNTLLSDVASTMAQKHYGSALVVSNGKLVGIFTTVDACRALHDILKTRTHANA
jgi:acetoin utilization protein AcuB